MSRFGKPSNGPKSKSLAYKILRFSTFLLMVHHTKHEKSLAYKDSAVGGSCSKASKNSKMSNFGKPSNGPKSKSLAYKILRFSTFLLMVHHAKHEKSLAYKDSAVGGSCSKASKNSKMSRFDKPSNGPKSKSLANS